MKNYRKIAPKKVRKILKQAATTISKYQKLCYAWEQTNNENLLIINSQHNDIKNKNKVINKLWLTIYILNALVFALALCNIM